MRYLFVNQFALSPNQSGGIRHYMLAKNLIKRGHDVHIIASNLHYSSREHFEVTGESEVIDGVSFHWIKTIPYNNGLTRLINHCEFSLKLLWLYIFQLQGYKPDVIMGSSPQPFAVIGAWLIARFTKARFWYEVRDLWPQSLLDLGIISRWHPLYFLFLGIEKFASQQAERIFCLMPGGIEYFVSKGVHIARLTWAPNGIDFGRTAEFRGTKVRPNTFEISYFGSHGPSDGLDFLVEVAHGLSDTNILFRLVGDGPEKSAIKRKVMKLGIRNVVLEDSVAKSDVFEVMASADACIALALPSPLYRWGISFNKIYDYFYMKKPIFFIGDVSCNPVEVSESGVVVRGFDVIVVQAALRKLASLPSEALAEMGMNGFNFGRSHHAIDEIARKFEDVPVIHK